MALAAVNFSTEVERLHKRLGTDECVAQAVTRRLREMAAADGAEDRGHPKAKAHCFVSAKSIWRYRTGRVQIPRWPTIRRAVQELLAETAFQSKDPNPQPELEVANLPEPWRLLLAQIPPGQRQMPVTVEHIDQLTRRSSWRSWSKSRTRSP